MEFKNSIVTRRTNAECEGKMAGWDKFTHKFNSNKNQSCFHWSGAVWISRGRRRLSVWQVLKANKTTVALTIHRCLFFYLLNNGAHDRAQKTPNDPESKWDDFFWCLLRQHSTVGLMTKKTNDMKTIIMNPINHENFDTDAGKYYILKGQNWAHRLLF